VQDECGEVVLFCKDLDLKHGLCAFNVVLVGSADECVGRVLYSVAFKKYVFDRQGSAVPLSQTASDEIRRFLRGLARARKKELKDVV